MCNSTDENSDLYYNETPSADVQERDIDLLVAEELSSSIIFVQWFCEQLYGANSDSTPLSINDVEVRHSCLHIGDGYGESDIVVRLKDQLGRHHILLIEDKINASFTHEQADRYRKRLKTIIRTDNLADGKTVLMAPKSYLDTKPSAAVFDGNISYESLIEYFDRKSKESNVEDLAMRYSYRRDFILRAVYKKSHSGSVVNPDPRICDFREQYARLVREKAPELQLGMLTKVKEPNEWVRFPDALSNSGRPNRFLLIHKPFGRVALQISQDVESMTESIKQFRNLISGEPDMAIDPAKKSFSVYIDTPRLEMRKPLTDQSECVEQAISSLLRLRAWYENNAAVIGAILGKPQ